MIGRRDAVWFLVTAMLFGLVALAVLVVTALAGWDGFLWVRRGR